MYRLSDIFIGDYPTVSFESGILIKCPPATPILAAADGLVVVLSNDKDGGLITILHDGFFTLYERLSSFSVGKDERVIAGQLIGYSGDHGFWFGIAEDEGDHTYTDNLDPFGKSVLWDVRGLTEPVQPIINQVVISIRDHGILEAQAAQYRLIVNSLHGTSFPEFVKYEKLIPIDLSLTPDDTTGGQTVSAYVKRLIEKSRIKSRHIAALEQKIAAMEAGQPKQATKSPGILKRIKRHILVEKQLPMS